MEASRRHGSFDMRWPSAGAAYTQAGESRRPPPRLRLVPQESGSVADLREREEAGTRRLMAAMAAAHTPR
jgi:hypothetical protein